MVQQGHKLAAGQLQGRVGRAGDVPVLLPETDLDAPVPGRVLREHLAHSGLGGGVVGDAQLEVGIELAEHRLDGLAQVDFVSVVDGHDDRDDRLAGEAFDAPADGLPIRVRERVVPPRPLPVRGVPLLPVPGLRAAKQAGDAAQRLGAEQPVQGIEESAREAPGQALAHGLDLMAELLDLGAAHVDEAVGGQQLLAQLAHHAAHDLRTGLQEVRADLHRGQILAARAEDQARGLAHEVVGLVLAEVRVVLELVHIAAAAVAVVAADVVQAQHGLALREQERHPVRPVTPRLQVHAPDHGRPRLRKLARGEHPHHGNMRLHAH